MSRKTKLRAQQRQAAAAAQPSASQDDTLEIDVEDETDPSVILSGDFNIEETDEPDEGDEGTTIEDEHQEEAEAEPEPDPKTESAEDPFDVLKRQYEEAQAVSAAAEARWQAAQTERVAEQQRVADEKAALERQFEDEKRRASDLEGQVGKYQLDEINNHKTIIEHAIAAANADKELYRRQYREARVEGNLDAELAATEALSEVGYRIQQLNAGHEVIKDKLEQAQKAPPPETKAAPVVKEPAPVQTPAVVAQPADPFEAEIASYPARDQEWLRSHKADLANDPNKVAILRAAAVLATGPKHKLTAGTDAFYAFLDDQMGYAEAKPEPAPNPEAAPAPKKPKTQIVPGAPVSRSGTGTGTKPGADYASPHEKEAARICGMSVAKWREYQRLGSEGKLDGWKSF
jgi:hypothetical protein